MSIFMIDIETDGPIPGKYSMVSFGAVLVEPALDKTFYGQLKPISDKWNPEALAISGHSREECFSFDAPERVMARFTQWLSRHSQGKARFYSDNNGFDWQFINWYFHYFTGSNPFGYSSSNLGSLYQGMTKDTSKSFKHFRQTHHSHHPVDDAIGNAEALLYFKHSLGLKIDI